MKGIFKRFETTAQKKENDINFNWIATVSCDALSDYSTINEIRSEIARRIADELYDTVKDQILSKPGMAKLLNEIRLELAKKLTQ